MKMRPFLFSLHRSGENTYAVLRGNCNIVFSDNEVMEAIVRAVTEWVKKDPDGRLEWKNSSHDLNIGDLSFYVDNLALKSFLNKHEISDFNIEIFTNNTDTISYTYDTVLVNDFELEEV